MIRTLAALLCLVVAAAAACSGDDGDDRAQMLTGSTSTPPVAVERPVATPAPGSPTPRAASPDLTRALLTLEDMPTGFTLTGPRPDREGSKPCGKSAELRARAIQNLEAEFTKGSLGPFVTHTIGSYKSGDAGIAFDYARAVFEDCRTWTEPGDDGVPIEYRASPLSFPRLGDQTFAMRVDAKIGTVDAQVDIVFVRRGDVIFLIGNTMGGLGVATVDTPLTEQLVRKADEKLGALR